jgi:hypothetical protein
VDIWTIWIANALDSQCHRIIACHAHKLWIAMDFLSLASIHAKSLLTTNGKILPAVFHKIKDAMG